MRKYSVLLKRVIGSLILIIPFIMQGQNAPVTSAGSSSSCPGGTVSVPITVSNFSQITAVSLRLDFNPTLMDFTGYANLNAGLSGCLVNPILVTPTLKKLMIIWSNINPLTLVNGSKLVDLNFTYSSGSPVLAFNNTANSGSDCEYANQSGNPLNDIPSATYYLDATITGLGVGVAGSISGTSSVCQGQNTVPYSVPAITNATSYSWSYSGTGVTINNPTSNNITINFGPSATSGNLNVTGVNACGNVSLSPNFPIALNPLPAAVAGADRAICKNSGTTLGATAVSGNTYSWTSVPPGFTSTLSNPTVTPLVTTAYTLVETVTATGCSNTHAVNVTVNPLPVPVINGATTAGVGTTQIYTTETGMSNYIWTVSAQGIPTAGGTSTSNTITVLWNTSGAASVSVNYTNGNNCTAIAPTVYPVNVQSAPPPAGTISGTPVVCQGSTNVAYSVAAIPGATGYVWQLPSGASIASGLNTANITVNYSYSAISGNISVYGVNAIGNGLPSPNYFIIVNSPTIPVISGTVTACVNSTGVYSTQVGMTNYTWSVSSGGSVVSGGGTNSISVNWNTLGAQTVSVNFTNGNSCNAASPTVYNVQVNSRPEPVIAGPASVCAGSSANIYSTSPGMTAYQWVISAGGVITSGNGTSSVTVTWNTPGNETIGVNYENAAGCSAIQASVFPVNVSVLPFPVIMGEDTLCQETANVVYETQPNNTGYLWTVSSGGTITSGAGTYSITVFWNSSGSQLVEVNYTNSNGCHAPAPALFNVTVLPKPAAAGSVIGTSSVCAGAEGVSYSVPVIANASSYSWALPAGASILSGANTNDIVINYAPTAVSGFITVSGENNCGAGVMSPEFPVAVNPLPATPIASTNGDTLFSSAAFGNQWYYDAASGGTGNTIPGATGQIHIATQDGFYWTIVTISDCSSASSNRIQKLHVGQGELTESGFSIYPNPTDGRFTIAITSPEQKTFDLVILNSLGQIVLWMNDMNFSGEFREQIDLRNVPAGIYTVILKNKSANSIQRLLKK